MSTMRGPALYRSLLESLPGLGSGSFAGESVVLGLSRRSLLAHSSSAVVIPLAGAGPSSPRYSHAIAAEEKLRSFSPNGKLFLTFSVVKSTSEGKKESRVVDLWSATSQRKLRTLDVTDTHEDFIFDDTFGRPSWHPDSSSVLYLAQPSKPKDSSAGDVDKFRYSPTYGEKFPSVRSQPEGRQPALFLLQFSPSSLDVKQIEVPPSKDDLPISFAQPVFLPAKAGHFRVLAMGFQPLPDGRPLGIIYCQNRPCSLYTFSIVDGIAKDFVRITEAGRSPRSPRVYWSGKDKATAVFISNAASGPHGACATMHAFKACAGEESKPQVLVAEVAAPNTKGGFPGLFIDQLPERPFLVSKKGGAFVTCTSVDRSRRVALAIPLESGEIVNLTPWPKGNEEDPAFPHLSFPRKGTQDNTEVLSYGVLATDGGSRILAVRSGMAQPREAVLFDFDKRDSKVIWQSLPAEGDEYDEVGNQLREGLAKLDWSVLSLPCPANASSTRSTNGEVLLLSPILIDPTASATPNLPPLVTIPHGGPHGTYTTDWSNEYTALALSGYRVALVNYPGSLGWGQEFVDALNKLDENGKGGIGTVDVEAVVGVPHYLNQLSLASRTKGKRLLMGGSHGGYISTHITARYPDEFDAVVLRNPVTDLSSMLFATDIPDWVYSEADLPYPFDAPPSALPESEDHRERLRRMSPLTYVKGVKAPTLLMIGADDKRVPPDQGRAWYHALRANAAKGTAVGEVDMLVFPGEGHALDNLAETQITSFEALFAFLEKHTVF